MTDAREIIAHHLCEMAAQGWPGISPFERAAYRTTAQGMVGAIESAGFRIIGPDEVDQVTLEKCAEVVREMVPNIPPDGPSTDVQESEYMALGHALTALRALGRKA